MKLYNYWRSSASYRVRIGLHHKGIPFVYVPVNLIVGGGQQHEDTYRTKNPMAQVPTLEIEDGGLVRRLGQSIAILEWLEDRYPAMPLLPADPFQRARARQLAEVVNSGIQPFQNLSVMKIVKTELHGDEQAFARRFIEKGLNAFDEISEEVAGKFCVGDELSLADVFLIPQLYGSRRFGVDLSAFPRLLEIEARCLALPAFQAAHPDKQIDAVPA
jgi:maleylpyruvate isomerase